MQSNANIVINYYGIQRNMNVIHCQMKATLAAMRCMGQPIKHAATQLMCEYGNNNRIIIIQNINPVTCFSQWR